MKPVIDCVRSKGDEVKGIRGSIMVKPRTNEHTELIITFDNAGLIKDGKVPTICGVCTWYREKDDKNRPTGSGFCHYNPPTVVTVRPSISERCVVSFFEYHCSFWHILRAFEAELYEYVYNKNVQQEST